MSTDLENFIRVGRDGRTLEESGTGRPFVPMGCNYYDAHTGWPPRVWSRFQRSAVKRQFRMMQDLGLNAIRVWVQWSVFMPTRGRLSPRAMDLCREMLELAKEAGIRVNLTGPDFWEGTPPWLSPAETQEYQHLVNPLYQEAHAQFWELFAAAIAREEIVYGFDLVNEPFMPWDGKRLRKLWNLWIVDRYGSINAAARAWGNSSSMDLKRREVPPPPNCRVVGSQYLLDYQTFREEMALRWIQHTVKAIRGVDPRHLITVGLHQSGCPLEEVIPLRYTAFDPYRLKSCLSYISLHWYPFGNPLTASCQPYDLPENRERSLSIFLANCRYHTVGIPLLLEEFSYYGGGAPKFWGGVLPHRSEREQDRFSCEMMQVSRRVAAGMLNWPLQDTPTSTDTSAFGGFYSASGELKPWGRSFRAFVRRDAGRRPRRPSDGVIVRVRRASLLTDWPFCARILEKCFRLTRKGEMWTFRVAEDQ